MSLSLKLLASVSSRIVVALSGLLAMPIYLQRLGADDFGVVGIFLSLQVIVNFLDLGLGATLIRKLSMSYPHDKDLSYQLARSYEFAYVCLALLAGVVLWMLAPWLATHWLNAQSAQLERLPHVLQIATVCICLNWLTNIYAGTLTGQEEQAALSLHQSIWALLRVIIPMLALYWQPSLLSFFYSQLCVSLLQVLGMRWVAFRHLQPQNPSFLKMNLTLLKADAAFSLGMLGIAVTTFILTQFDKIVLSKMLSLREYGLYSLCVTLAGGIYLGVQPLFYLLYPRFTRLLETKQTETLLELYQLSSQTMALLVIPIASVIMAFPSETLFVWTGNPEVAEQGKWILRVLVLANTINAIMNLPYCLQLAGGWSSLSFLVNGLSVLVCLPLTIWGVGLWGSLGSAFVLLGLNVILYSLIPTVVYSRFLKQARWDWYKYASLAPACSSCLLMIFASYVWQPQGNRLLDLFVLILLIFLAACFTLLSTPKTRALIIRHIQSFRFFNKPRQSTTPP